MIRSTDKSGIFTYKGMEFILLHISLTNLSPQVYRILTINANHTLHDLHFFIQGAFEWLGSDRFYFDVDTDFMKKSLKTIFAEQKQIHYVYLGWTHSIVLVPNQEVPGNVSVLSPCIDGKRSRPPEFIHTSEGYQEFLRIVMDPEHPQYEEMIATAEKDTYGRKFDPEYFYSRAANRKIDYYLSKSGLCLEEGFVGSIESIDEGRIYIHTDHGPISLSELEDLLRGYANQASVRIKILPD